MKRKPEEKAFKLLVIGNSFSVDATVFLSAIAKSAGIEIIVGCAHDSGQSLDGHWEKIQHNETIKAYHKWTPDGYTSEPNAFVKDIVVDEDWDLITYQQVSGKSFDYATFQPYLNEVHEFVKERVTNADCSYGFQLTWAFASDFPGLNRVGLTQKEMYENIAETYQQAMQEMDFDILIPSGTAIQNARTNDYLRSVGNELTRDGYHLETGLGRYIAALTVFESVLAGVYKKDLFHDVEFYPEEHGVSKFLAYLAKVAVKNAVLNPFKITPISGGE